MRMTNERSLDRLLSLLAEALDEADRQRDTLAAALLAECIQAVETSLLQSGTHS
jgi:hypothetical protein